MKNRRFKFIVLTITIILFTPLIAMQFTNEVNWTLFDFIIAGILLFGTGLSFEFIMQKITKLNYKIILIAVLLLVLLLIWSELAVGIFDF